MGVRAPCKMTASVINISPHFYAVTFSWSGKGYECVSAALAGFFQAGFGAINPFGDAVFGFVPGTRRRFGYNRADSEIRLTPGRPRCGSDLPELFGEGQSTLKRGVRQNKHEGPGCIFDRNISLPNGRRKSARELFDVTFDGGVTVLAEQFATTINVDNHERNGANLRPSAIRFSQQAINIGATIQQPGLLVGDGERTDQRPQTSVTYRKDKLVAHGLKKKTFVRFPFSRVRVSDQQGSRRGLRFLIRQQNAERRLQS